MERKGVWTDHRVWKSPAPALAPDAAAAAAADPATAATAEEAPGNRWHKLHYGNTTSLQERHDMAFGVQHQ